MKKDTYKTTGCLALLLAGCLGMGTMLPCTAFAAGPGEGTAVVTPAGPGGSTEGQDTAGPGVTKPGTGNTNTNSSVSGNTNTQADSTETVSSNPNAWKKVNGVYQMEDGSAISGVLSRGIDVSRWQGDIDWKQVASDDVSFVMLGTRSKGAVDPYFHKNIKEASAAGIKVGVYIYSLATTTDMAVQEADFVLDLIYDYPVSYPVAFDMEDSTQAALTKDQLADIANAFCSRISQAGYYPIIYANDNWLANRLDMSKMNYPVWVARYSARPVYQNPVMWQATSSGSVKGINGRVDIDYQYKDFSSVIPANTWRTIDGKSYYYQNYTKLKNGWADDNGTWYYMDSDGLASKGWMTLSGKKYYLDESSGKMVTGWHSENGKWYYLGSSGDLSSGWISDGESWYYSDKDGVMQTGWLELGGKHYYLKGSGAMANGWRQMDGVWYYFDGSGAMVTGWQQLGADWYYFDGSGHMAEGLTEVGGVSYYLEPGAGTMAANRAVTIDGINYQAAADGSLGRVAEETAAGGQNTAAGDQTTAGDQNAAAGGQNTTAAGEKQGESQVSPGTAPSSGAGGDVVITPVVK